jgi:hypothetical protein
MGWRIVNGKRYFYDAYRLGDEVIVTYLGNGPAAQWAARELEQRKQAREARKRSLAAAIAKLKQFGEETDGETLLLRRQVDIGGSTASQVSNCRGTGETSSPGHAAIVRHNGRV